MKMNSDKERFLIIDDHPLFREALRAALALGFPNSLAVDAETLEDAEEVIKTSDHFDLALLDLNIPGVQGTDGLIYLRKTFPRLPVVVISGYDEAAIIDHVMACGASGFISKSSKKPDLAAAVQKVIRGEVCLPENYTPGADQAAGDENLAIIEKISSLTPQQFKVLQMIREGLLNKQIAYELSVGETTVKAHVSEILRKLGVASRTQAVIEMAKLDLEHLQARHPLMGLQGDPSVKAAS